MKKAIIFGITGQDGSHLTDLLLEKDYEVIGVTRRVSVDTTSRISTLLENKNLKLESGDITDAHSVINILKNHQDAAEVYNLAAQSHVAVSFKQPALTWDITGKGCLNILQAMVDLDMKKSRFYQASSSEMYGKNYDVEVGMTSESKYQDEDTKFMPQSPYAIAKCAAHYMTRLYREGYGLHTSAGILFNHEGPRRGENFVTRKITKWIGDYIKWCNTKGIMPEDSIACGTEEELYVAGRTSRDQDLQFPKLRLGNLDAYRDWGYAGDYCEAMWMMLQQDQPDDYVICTGETHTVREFLQIAFSSVGLNKWDKFVTVDPEFYRPAEVDYLRGDCSKAKEKLGWNPKHSFEDLVKMMVMSDLS
jgi:GDPmannose 4,6-dehydratase